MAGKLGKNITRIVAGVVVLAVVVGAVLYFVTGDDMKKVTARFTAGVGLYPGTPVRQLGVNIGKITTVAPKGTYVEVGMEYESKYSLPANAYAVEVANSLVSDRYIQLAAYSGRGATLPDNATIPLSRTGAPAELDDIYKALNTLSTTLGPNGANSNGALSTLIKVGAANLKGNGTALGASIANLSKATTTLANGRTDLFGTVTNLRKFTDALNQSDGQVRKFNQQLATVAGDLASERQDLGGALKLLGLALNDVNAFVKKNASRLHTTVVGLKRTTNVLVRQKASLTETLAVAPVALANLVHSYQPNIGVLGTRSNLGALTDPGQVCVIIDATVSAVTKSTNGALGGTIGNILGPLTNQIVSTCQSLVKKSPDLQNLLSTDQIQAIAQGLVGQLGGLPGIITGG